jgi:hypothetical protein
MGPTSLYTKANLAMNAKNVQLAPADGQSFWLTFEQPTVGVQQCLLDPSGTLSCASQPSPAASPLIFPQRGSPPLLAQAVFLRDVDAGFQRLFANECDAGSTGTVACDVPAVIADVPPRADVNDVRASTTARNVSPTFFAWDEAGSDFRFVVLGRGDGGVQPATLKSSGRRPVPVFTGSNHGAVVFDTESLIPTGVQANEVYLGRYCL